MNRIIYSLLLVFLSGYSWTGLVAQSESQNVLPYPEQVYVQLNQELFLSGDTLWAGVFVLESELLRPSQLSQVAYLELWAEGAAVVRRRVVLDQSAAMVAIALPNDLRSGMYMVRAYTRWMQNGPEALFFKHWIRVVNPKMPPPVKEAGDQLFPLSVEVEIEGGHLIANQTQTLHVRAVAWDGSAASTHGYLVAGRTDTIQEFQLNERGYGQLEVLTKPETTYGLLVKTSEESYKSIDVGKSSTVGIGMRIVEEAGESYLQIVGGEDESRYRATVGIKKQGRLDLLPEISFRSDEGRRIRLAELSLNEGVSQFVLWDEEGRYCGTCFWNENERPNPEIEREPAGRMTTAITSRSIGRQPVGMASYHSRLAGLERLIPFCEEQLEHLEEWLPFVAGQIPVNQLGEQHSGELPIKAEVNGIILEGTVNDAGGDPVAGETVYLAFPGDIAWLHLAVTDSNGLFHFVLEPGIGQPASTIIRGGKTFNSSWSIQLNSGFAPKPELESWPTLTLDQASWSQLQTYDQIRQLATRYLDPEHDVNTPLGITLKTPIYGEPDFTYRFEDYTTMPTEEAFIEFISQAYIRKPNKVKTIYLLNTNREELFPGPPLFMIDGVPVVNSAEIFAVNYRLVDRIELVTHPYVLNGTFINGVLNLVTYQKDASSVVLRKGELRAELLIIPSSSSAGNQLLRGDHVPGFDQVNEIRQEMSADSPEPMSGSESVLPATIWVQSVGGG